MARRRRLKGVKRHRRIGFHTKRCKKSVAFRKQLKRLKKKQEVENAKRENSDDGACGSLGAGEDFSQRKDG